MNVRIESGWHEALLPEFSLTYFSQLTDYVRSEYANPNYHIYPPAAEIFAAFDATPFRQVKVVIIGQDPYHGPQQANGLAFSVNPSVKMPPSLVNIFKEIADDCSTPFPADGNLDRWARQGVLLLNAALTVREHQAGSHANIGWHRFTDAAVEALNRQRDNLVFMLWGSDAQRKGAGIDRERHLVLCAPHPSPLSAYRGFFGCKHFSQANQYLINHNKTPIIW